MRFVYEDPSADVAIWLDGEESTQWMAGEASQSVLRQRIMAALDSRSLHCTVVVRLEDGTMAASLREAEPLH